MCFALLDITVSVFLWGWWKTNNWYFSFVTIADCLLCVSFSFINQLGLFPCSKLQNISDISFIPEIDVGQGMWGAVFARSIAISFFLSAFSLQHFDTPAKIPLPPYGVTLFNCNRHMLCNDFVLLMFVLSFPIYSRCIFMPAIVCLKTTNLIVAENRLKSKVSEVIEISNKFVIQISILLSLLLILLLIKRWNFC